MLFRSVSQSRYHNQNNLIKDEYSNTLPLPNGNGFNVVWTATNFDGSKLLNGNGNVYQACRNWTYSGVSDTARIGLPTDTDINWTAYNSIFSCTFSERLYCFQQPSCGNAIVENGESCDDGNLNNGDGCSAICAIEPYTLVFVTSQTWNGNLGGVAGADAKCQQAAASVPAFAGSYWRAWISDNLGNTASNRLYHETKTYRSLGLGSSGGNIIIANNWNDLTDASLRNPINVDDGEYCVDDDDFYEG